MLTFFAIPKPFRGHIGLIQRNAIESWRRLPLVTRVVLFGEEDGLAQAARDLGVHHEPRIERTALGTPLISDAFRRAAAMTPGGHICYSNGDIVFGPDFCPVLQRCLRRFDLITGQRRDAEVRESIDFARPDWWSNLLAHAMQQGTWPGPHNMDYFVVCSSSPVLDMPPLAVGRRGWDAWMMWRALDLGLRVLDLTPGVVVVHQNHGYDHVPQASGHKWDGPESDRNLSAIPPEALHCAVYSSTHRIWLDRPFPRKRTLVRTLRSALGLKNPVSVLPPPPRGA